MYQLRTIDVWDTVLRRTCHPDLIKLATARYMAIQYHHALQPQYRDHHKLLRERCSIEGELARKNKADDEYTLHSVLESLLRRTLVKSDKSEILNDLLRYEFEHEQQHTYADPHIRQLLQEYPAERTLFLSDFYMPAEQILSLLHFHGFNDLISEGISSCDINLNKRSGNLFKYVQQKYGVAPSAHLHIGDNAWSDAEAPKRLGIHTIHYMPKEEHKLRELRENLFSSRSELFQHLEKTSLKEAKEYTTGFEAKAKSAFILGAKSAPLFIGFGLFTLETVIRTEAKHLYFMTREGEFFIRVYQMLAQRMAWSKNVAPPGHLLEVSRLATFSASVQSVTTQEMMRIWNLYSTQSMYAFAKTLKVDPALLTEISQKYKIDINEPIVHPWEDIRVRGLFNDDEFCSIIDKQVKADRATTLQYFAQCGFNSDISNICLVDIGWRGTIQDNIAQLFPSISMQGLYLGLQRFLNPQSKNCEKLAYGPNLNNSMDNAYLLDAVTPLEMLCNSPSGSVEGYLMDKTGHTIAEKAIDEEENRVHHEFVCHFQEGVLLAAKHWAEYIESHAITSDDLKQYAYTIWHKLIVQSPAELVDAYSSLNHNEIFGVGGYIAKSNVPSMQQILLALIQRRARYDVLCYVKQTQWTVGIWKRGDLNFAHKCMLASVLTAARYYKRLRQWHRRHTLPL